MTMKYHGKNRVSSIDVIRTGRQGLADGLYKYYYCSIGANEEIQINDLSSFTIAIIGDAGDSRIRVVESDRYVSSGEIIQAENVSVTLQIKGDASRFLLAGASDSFFSESKLEIIKSEDVHKVVKPWGYELWLNGQHPGYAFKMLFLKRGSKTSLQYHRHKQETNVIYSGTALLHYKNNEDIDNDVVRPEDIDNVLVESASAIDVSPFTLHRLEALTDLLQYETSTPHLDDVVRVHDDSKRKDGRIDSEHLE